MPWKLIVRALLKNKTLRKFITIKSNNPLDILANMYGNVLKKYPQLAKTAQTFKDLDIPQIEAVKKLAQLTKQTPKQVIDDLKTGKIDVKIKRLTKQQRDDVYESLESDVNQASLSSSWLAYGTFIPTKQNKNLGELIVVTKEGEKIKINKLLKRFEWDRMRNQIGVTRYKKGKRVGNSFGAGTLLHRFAPPKKYKWQKIGFVS